jgi:hypothetical protein
MTLIKWTCYSSVFAMFMFALVSSGNVALAQGKPKPIKIKSEFYDIAVKERGGTFVVLQFKSYHPVVPAAVASQEKLTIKPGGKEFATPQSEIKSSSFPLLSGERTEHEIALKDLNPDTIYYVGIIGYRKGGNVYFPLVNKEIRTLKRSLDINFTQLEMIDDSDDLSDGEFKFGFFAFDGTTSYPPPPLLDIQYPAIWISTQGLQGALGSALKFHISVGSGENKAILSATGTIVFSGDVLALAATGMDDDGDWRCGTGPVPPHAGAGDTECAEWATGYQKITFANKTDVSDGASLSEKEQYRAPFSLHAHPNNVDVEFRVKGYIDVSYE